MTRYFAMAMLIMMSGCSYDWIFFWEDDEPVASESGGEAEEGISEGKVDHDEDDSSPIKSLTKRQLELKIARLTARIEHLEMSLDRQKENFIILRKGMTTGLIPGEWQDGDPYFNTEGEGESMGSGRPMRKGSAYPSHTNPLDTILDMEKGSRGSKGLNNRERMEYERRLAKANNHFESGDYGKAISAYSEIGEDYSHKVTKGNHLLWLGASWFRLKDYQAARKHLNKLVRGFKTSPWIAEAKFLLGKADAKEGYTQRAITRYKKIINEYPKSNVAERSREELVRIEDNL